MTPFGQKLIELQEARRVSHDALAKSLNITPSELTAVKSGFRGPPSLVMIFQIERVLELSRYEIEDLKSAARLSNPQPHIGVSGLYPEAVELVNLLAQHIHAIPPAKIGDLLQRLRKIIAKM